MGRPRQRFQSACGDAPPDAFLAVQRLKKSPKLFMETYHKSMAGLERRRSIISFQFMLEMRQLEEDDESRFEEEFNVWLSDEPLTNDEICQLMREVERQRKHEGKPPLVQFLTSSKHGTATEPFGITIPRVLPKPDAGH